MTKLGELLKAEREKRGLSLHEIGMGLKINPKILKAIEDGDPQNLPAKTFLRGFVKSYAQYLRLDLNMILQLFQEEYGSTRPEEPAKAAQPPTPTAATPTPAPRYENSLKRPDDSALPVANNNRIYTILVAILLLTLIAFVAKMMDKYQKESEVSTVNVVDASTSTTTTVPETAESVAISGDESVATTTTLTTPETSTTLTPTTTLLVSTTTTPPPRSTSTTTITTTTLKPTTTTTTVTSTTTTSTTSTTSTLPAVKTANTEVILEALNRVTIRFSLNGGQKWETLELNPDQVHTFRSKSGVQLEVSDGGAVNVIMNGRDRGVPGTIGKPIKLTFP